MNRFVKSTWFKIIVAIFVMLFVLIIYAAAGSKGSSPLSSAAGTATKPVSSASSKVGKGLSRVFNTKSAYEEEIKSLKKEIAGYQKELADYEQL
ncbi:MAG: hypothetical protein MJ111_02185, partial [Clostridia bacterium]|nr:hypothetical protein [Clostridia bacterium]